MAGGKYELTDETREVAGVVLHRIRALMPIAGIVAAGDLGGWAERHENLSHEGAAWIGGNAQVWGRATVSDDGLVGEDARVCAAARVMGRARVGGSSVLFGDAWVSGRSRVGRQAIVGGEAMLVGSMEALVTPIFISGLAYPVTIADRHMAIGCEAHLVDDWRSFDDRRIAKMDAAPAARFWRDFGPQLLALCAATGRPMAPSLTDFPQSTTETF